MVTASEGKGGCTLVVTQSARSVTLGYSGVPSIRGVSDETAVVRTVILQCEVRVTSWRKLRREKGKEEVREEGTGRKEEGRKEGRKDERKEEVNEEDEVEDRKEKERAG